MKKKQITQEQYYKFPYHYIPSLEKDNFRHYKGEAWYIEYICFLEFLKNYLKKIHPVNNLLDVGCGDGRILNELSYSFNIPDIKGIDISYRSIEFAKLFATNKNISFECLDITKNAKQYDVILLIEVFEHIEPENRKIFLETIYNSMHKNSILIVTIPHKNRKMDNRHYEHFTLNSFLENFNIFKCIDYKFIARKSLKAKLFYKLLENNFFILKNQPLLNFIFKSYCKNFIAKNESEALRIFGVFKK